MKTRRMKPHEAELLACLYHYGPQTIEGLKMHRRLVTGQMINRPETTISAMQGRGWVTSRMAIVRSATSRRQTDHVVIDVIAATRAGVAAMRESMKHGRRYAGRS